ncbi:uncharacterized protein [Dysidea avara]|uniref:uncharacterized protein n=1 Tax=Dysidea avara TaxID=196820 RepID=UPI003321C9F7
MSTGNVFKHFYPQLVKTLPMDDVTFIAELFAANLLPGDARDIVHAKPTQASKAAYFLDHFIQPSVAAGVGRSFDDLIKVMEDSDYGGVKELAKLIRSRLMQGMAEEEEAINSSAAYNKIRKHYPQITKLHISAILAQLYADEVITLEQKMEIGTISLETNKMMYFLDNILIPSLQADLTQKYIGFINVLKGSDDPDMQKMAEKIG